VSTGVETAAGKGAKFYNSVMGIDSTVDEQFEADRKNYDSFTNSIADLMSGISRNAHGVQSLVDSMRKFTQGLVSFNGEDQRAVCVVQFTDAANHFYLAAEAHIVTARQVESNLKGIQDHIALIKKEISERDRILSDYDKARQEVIAEQKKAPPNPTQIQIIQSRVDVTKANYERKNDDTRRQISDMYRNRTIHTDYKALVASMAGLFTQAGQIFQQVSNQINVAQPPPSIAPTPIPPQSLPIPVIVTQPLPTPVYAVQQPLPTPVYASPSPTYVAAPVVAASVASKQAPLPPRSAGPSVPPKSQIRQARALYAFTAEQSTEMSLNAGDIIVLTQDTHPEWWSGTCNGRSGEFPANYVQRI